MKTVKLQKTIDTKIELNPSLSNISTTEQMSKVKPQMTALQSVGLQRSKEQIEQYQKQEKLQQTFIRLKQNLEACREARPDNLDTTKNENAIDHFDNMVSTIESKMEEMKIAAEKQIQYIRDNLTRALSSQEKKLSYAQDKLNKAKERKNKVKKTKEEIKLEKQIQQLIIDFKRTNPDRDVEYYFPNYKQLIGSNPPPVAEPPPPALPETNNNLVIEPLEEEEPEEEPDFSELTPWQRFQKVNSSMTLYNQYHKAKEMGIEPGIPEPEKPMKRRAKVVKTAAETISREDLAKIIPNYA